LHDYAMVNVLHRPLKLCDLSSRIADRFGENANPKLGALGRDDLDLLNENDSSRDANTSRIPCATALASSVQSPRAASHSSI